MNQATNYGFKNVCINVFRTQNVFAQMMFSSTVFSGPLILSLKVIALVSEN